LIHRVGLGQQALDEIVFDHVSVSGNGKIRNARGPQAFCDWPGGMSVEIDVDDGDIEVALFQRFQRDRDAAGHRHRSRAHMQQDVFDREGDQFIVFHQQ
jgi:hypothetical protein